MSLAASSPRKKPKKDGGKPSLICAVCKRRYQPVQTPGKRPIYSICPDCRQDVASPDSVAAARCSR